jgi:hypothetical protein
MTSIPKKYSYTNTDGLHWPDAEAGDNLFYSIDFSCWLHEEGELIESFEWIVPEGIDEGESFITGTTGHVELGTPSIGSFKVKCKLITSELGLVQTNVIPMILRVY